ncbi:MAG: hypothetical protein H0X30_08310 [Anaerolineae bacterium]|nr:hypothetical protein [Anaerolineae bacterium]
MPKQKKQSKRKPVPRQTRKFQLRVDHPKDAHVLEILNFARSQRREVTIIRESIALYWALENGNLEALFDVFPQYKAQFAPSTAEALRQFMEILRQQQVVQPKQESQSTGQGDPKQIAAPSFAMPVFEDDDQPTLIFNKVTETKNGSSLNFINMSKQLVKK